MLRRQWQRELQAEEGDSSYDEEDDFEEMDEKAADVDEGSTRVNKIYQGEDGKRIAKELRDKERKQTRQLFSDPQQVFGGLPIHDAPKIPIIKSLPKDQLKFKANQSKQIKKFSLNEFLDKYLEDDKQAAHAPGLADAEHLKLQNQFALEILHLVAFC